VSRKGTTHRIFIFLVIVLHWKGQKKNKKKKKKKKEEEVCIENSQAQETSPSLSSVVNL
jgi:hypothetical protein